MPSNVVFVVTLTVEFFQAVLALEREGLDVHAVMYSQISFLRENCITSFKLTFMQNLHFKVVLSDVDFQAVFPGVTFVCAKFACKLMISAIRS